MFNQMTFADHCLNSFGKNPTKNTQMWLNDIKSSHKFRIEDEVMEQLDIDNIHKLSHQAERLWSFMNLPMPVCWFEFRTIASDGEEAMIGAVVHEEGDNLVFSVWIFNADTNVLRPPIGQMRIKRGTMDFWHGIAESDPYNRIPEMLETNKGIQRWVFYRMVHILMVINCRNGFVIDTMTPPKKSNQLRRLRGFHPLYEHKVVKLHPRYTQVRINAAGDTQEMRLHWVRGHFKVRRTGIFWWAPYIRGDAKHGVIEHSYEVEA